VEVSLRLPTPFDVALSLASLQRSSYGAPYHFSADGRTVRRSVRLGGILALAEFDFAGGEVLTARVLASRKAEVGSAIPVSPEQLERLAATSWSLNDDLDDCWAVLGKDPDFAPVAARYQGMRLARVPNLYEALLVAILGQQISVRAANACRLRLMASLGEYLEVTGNTYTTYPLPRSLLVAGEEELRGLGTGGQKARYLRALAEAAIAGKLEQKVFDGLSDEEAIALLCEIPGVGRWTAEVALLRGLGRLDAFPAGDLGLQVAAQRVLGLEARPSERQLRVLAERWRPWRGYAALYLWGYLRDST
jgi:DNA-3-methyladenine glycosylase II